MRWLLATVACTHPLGAHVLSVSQGNLQISGAELRYELRMPLSEVPQGDDPHGSLLDAFRIARQDETATRVSGDCREEAGQGVLACTAVYRFTAAPDRVSVRCDFPSVTVPHHMHILRSGTGEVARQTVLDITSREAEIRFTAPTFRERVATEVGAGMRKVAASPDLLLFLLALVLASRSRREFAGCAGAFLLAQSIVALGSNALAWAPPARFLEAAAALTVAYLAAEILFLPETGNRWLICGAMGCFHGLFLGAFLLTARMNPGLVLPGALGIEALVACGLGALRLRLVSGQCERLGAVLLLVGGLGWFGLRLLG